MALPSENWNIDGNGFRGTRTGTRRYDLSFQETGVSDESSNYA
jgi:hypothetical protein